MTENTEGSSNNMMSYVLGGVLVVAVVAGGYFLRPKPATTSPTGDQPSVANAPTAPAVMTGPITKLDCDTQYYNPVIGFSKYYLSVEGVDIAGASEVTCTTTVTQEDKVVVTETSSVPLTQNAARGGLVFKCSTSALELLPTVPTTVDITLTDDNDQTATCSALFALPQP